MAGKLIGEGDGECACDCVADLTRLQADSLVSLCHKWPIE